MQLKKLDSSFYSDHTSLTNPLDFENGTWASNKTRGYGIVLISFNGLTFGIPLRSHIKHDACYVVERATVLGEKGMGVNTSDTHILQSNSYRFSTLVNYHNQLGL